MNEENIRKYAELMKELSLTGIEITEDGRTLRLERMGSPLPPAQVITVPDSVAEAPAAERSAAGGVTSPMVGIFYAAPAENADPFVKVGDRVKRGDTLCIIEAMKLMNEITAETDGIVTEICAKNGQVVDYGTVLMRIE